MNVKSLLQNSKTFRERSFKDLCFAKYFIDTYDLQITPERLKFILQEYTTRDREWRALQRKHEYLRGEDWEEGKKLSKIKQESLGYNVKENERISQN